MLGSIDMDGALVAPKEVDKLLDSSCNKSLRDELDMLSRINDNDYADNNRDVKP